MQHLRTAVLLTIVLTVLLGIVYPLVMTGICQVLFPSQANGSLVRDSSGNVIGSALLAQNFTQPAVLPSAAVGGRQRRLRRHRIRRLEPGPDQPEADRHRHGPHGGLPRGKRPGRRRAGAGGRGDHVRQRPRPGHQSRQCADSGQPGGESARPVGGPGARHGQPVHRRPHASVSSASRA